MTLGKAVDHKIIALAARGMNHSDIAEYVQDIYGLDISKTLVSNITDQVISKAVYCLLGLNQQGRKELIGMYIGKNESAAYWLTILNELQNTRRGRYTHCVH